MTFGMIHDEYFIDTSNNNYINNGMRCCGNSSGKVYPVFDYWMPSDLNYKKYIGNGIILEVFNNLLINF